MNDEKRRWQPQSENKTRHSGRRFGERKIIAHNAEKESSKRWIERQLVDPYVQAARRAGYRSRAAYKLFELDEETKFLTGKRAVIDLGCAPGGWLQILSEKGVSKIVGIDLLHTEPISGVDIVEGDIQDQDQRQLLLDHLGQRPDLIISDMAANTTGHKQTDHLRTLRLAELAIEFALENLALKGDFVTKVFQGGASSEMLQILKANFKKVRHIKPSASRSSSPEIYVVAKGFRGAS